MLVSLVLFVVGCAGTPTSEMNTGIQDIESEPLVMANEQVLNLISLMSVDTMVEINSSVEAVHGTHIPIDVIPKTGRLTVIVSFLDKPVDFQLFLVDEENTTKWEMLIELLPESLNSEYAYFGEFETPWNEFTYRLVGKQLSTGDEFSVNVPRSYPSYN